MKTTHITVGPQGLEIHYDPQSKQLRLTGVDTVSAHQATLQFDPQATRLLFETVILAAVRCGGSIGTDDVEKPKIQ